MPLSCLCYWWLSKACAWILVKQAASRISGLKPVSLSNQGRNTLSFGLRSMPARRLRVSCAVCFLFWVCLNILWFSLVLSCLGEMIRYIYSRKSNLIQNVATFGCSSLFLLPSMFSWLFDIFWFWKYAINLVKVNILAKSFFYYSL